MWGCGINALYFKSNGKDLLFVLEFYCGFYLHKTAKFYLPDNSFGTGPVPFAATAVNSMASLRRGEIVRES